MNLHDNRVAFNFDSARRYPANLPFDPPESYPEYCGSGINKVNQIYPGVRDLLFQLGMDRDNFSTKNWNPLGEIIKPGMTVFLKPNTVVHEHEGKQDVFSVIIHGSVIRPVLDYVCIALKNEGRIIFGDSQLFLSHFDKAMEASHIQHLLEWYGDKTAVPIECTDLRINRGVRTYLYGKWGRAPVKMDPRGYCFVDLGNRSYFKDIDPGRLRIAIASHKNMCKHHANGNHEYLFPQSYLDSDVVISIPKLKTHRRTAVTLALKNFMGLPALKDSLPHFITGSAKEGGDQYINPSGRKRICTWLHDNIQSSPYIPVKFVCAVAKKLLWNSHYVFPFKDDIYEAMWYGNDTLWRTLLDLNRAAFYADKAGKICSTPQRNFFGMIDGIVAGEKDGPLAPDPVYAGALIAGFNPVALDAAGATLMGFDIEKIPLIDKGFQDGVGPSPIFTGSKEGIRILNGSHAMNLDELARLKLFNFEPHPGWKGHVELN